MKNFLGGEGRGGMRTKKGRGWTVADLRSGEKSLAKMRRVVFWGACFHPHFGRQGACYDITKPADSQTNKNFSENNCMTAEFYKNVHPIKQTTSDSGS